MLENTCGVSMGDQSFARTAAWLCHPVTIAAVALMIVNDHLLKRLWPGTVTGKRRDPGRLPRSRDGQRMSMAPGPGG
jgi:hypothetical protein